MTDHDKEAERREALRNLRRLTGIILDKLEEGSDKRLMDPKEIRLLGGTAIRSIRLYLQALESQKDPLEQETERWKEAPMRIRREDQTASGK
jgi:hypothetical protein